MTAEGLVFAIADNWEALCCSLPLLTLAPLVLETILELSVSFDGEKGGSEPESGGESGRLSVEEDAAKATADAAAVLALLATE